MYIIRTTNKMLIMWQFNSAQVRKYVKDKGGLDYNEKSKSVVHLLYDK